MDCMVDLETLGSGSNSVIIAIGAVKFSPASKSIAGRFYTRVDPQSCAELGMVIDSSTVLWWMQQNEAARNEFKGTLPNIRVALTGFTHFLNAQMNPNDKSNKVWGNGAGFDNVILANAYKAAKMDCPWGYRDNRCYRTIRCLYPDVPYREPAIAHRADHDAEAQAVHLMEIWPKLRSA